LFKDEPMRFSRKQKTNLRRKAKERQKSRRKARLGSRTAG
jgi:hypothetical protein